MPIHHFLPLILAAGLLAGCATYQPKNLSPAATQGELQRRSLKDAGLQRFLATHGVPPSESDEWDLARLTLAAFYFSPELDLARAQLAEAEAGVRIASALPNPTFNFTPGYNQDATGGVTPWILGYALNLPLELAGNRGYRSADARQQAEAARASLAAAAWTARSAVRRALTDLDAAEGAVLLWREQTPLLAQAAQLIQTQVNAGESPSIEAVQARIALDRATLAAREADRAVALARSRLAEAIGVQLPALADVRLSYRGLANPSAPLAPAEAHRLAAQNRVDLLAALATYAASQSALQGEIARQSLDLAIGPGYQLDQGEGKWSLSLTLTLPLFHQNQGPIAAAQARRESAAAKFLALQHRVLAEVDRTAADYASAFGDLETVKTIRAGLAQQAGAIRAQQAAGEISRLDLTRAQIELADTARAELDARIRAARAVAAFEDAIQRPLEWPETAWRTATRPAGN